MLLHNFVLTNYAEHRIRVLSIPPKFPADKKAQSPLSPKWSISQGGTGADLGAAKPIQIGTNLYSWNDGGHKKLILGRMGSGYRGFTIGLNASKINDGIWDNIEPLSDKTGKSLSPLPLSPECLEIEHPALMISQGYSRNDYDNINVMKSLHFKTTLQVTKMILDNKYKDPRFNPAGWDISSHTAHLNAFISFQNLRADKNQALGHGQSFAIAVTLFDIRDKLYMSKEDRRNGDHVLRNAYGESHYFHKTQSRYIYTPPADIEYVVNITNQGQYNRWASVDLDLLKYIKGDASTQTPNIFDRLNAYQTKICTPLQISENTCPISKLTSQNFQDYVIVGMNLAWEVSSLHDVEAHISDISIQYTK